MLGEMAGLSEEQGASGWKKGAGSFRFLQELREASSFTEVGSLAGKMVVGLLPGLASTAREQRQWGLWG